VETSLTILYTHRLRGELALLPRLHTFIGRLRAEHAAGGRALLIDLGESCTPEVFPCALTGGRSTLIAFDAMGYDAANVRGTLAAEDRARLDAMFLNVVPIDEVHRLEKEGVMIGVAVGAADDALYVEIDAADATALDGGHLRLAGIEVGQVGMVRLESSERGWRLAAEGVFTMPPDVLPTATISGMIEMILSEAHYTRKKRG
jgi:hypothetical protein